MRISIKTMKWQKSAKAFFPLFQKGLRSSIKHAAATYLAQARSENCWLTGRIWPVLDYLLAEQEVDRSMPLNRQIDSDYLIWPCSTENTLKHVACDLWKMTFSGLRQRWCPWPRHESVEPLGQEYYQEAALAWKQRWVDFCNNAERDSWS